MSKGTKNRGFDFHCHVDLHPNPPGIISDCERKQIAVLAVTTTPKAWSQNLIWTKSSTYVHAAVGLHPELVFNRHHEIDLLEKIISKSRLVGEIGLDGNSKYRKSYSKQKEVYTRALKACQKHGGRVVSIHSRRAVKDVIQIIEKYTNPKDVLCILHWFSGSLTEARRAIDVGCYFSVNSAMLGSDPGRNLVQSLPPDRILPETDSPFTKVNGGESTPLESVRTLSQMAELYRGSVTEMFSIVTKTAYRVFTFAGIDIGHDFRI